MWRRLGEDEKRVMVGATGASVFGVIVGVVIVALIASGTGYRATPCIFGLRTLTQNSQGCFTCSTAVTVQADTGAVMKTLTLPTPGVTTCIKTPIRGNADNLSSLTCDDFREFKLSDPPVVMYKNGNNDIYLPEEPDSSNATLIILGLVIGLAIIAPCVVYAVIVYRRRKAAKQDHYNHRMACKRSDFELPNSPLDVSLLVPWTPRHRSPVTGAVVTPPSGMTAHVTFKALKGGRVLSVQHTVTLPNLPTGTDELAQKGANSRLNVKLGYCTLPNLTLTTKKPAVATGLAWGTTWTFPAVMFELDPMLADMFTVPDIEALITITSMESAVVKAERSSSSGGGSGSDSSDEERPALPERSTTAAEGSEIYKGYMSSRVPASTWFEPVRDSELEAAHGALMKAGEASSTAPASTRLYDLPRAACADGFPMIQWLAAAFHVNGNSATYIRATEDTKAVLHLHARAGTVGDEGARYTVALERSPIDGLFRLCLRTDKERIVTALVKDIQELFSAPVRPPSVSADDSGTLPRSI